MRTLNTTTVRFCLRNVDISVTNKLGTNTKLKIYLYFLNTSKQTILSKEKFEMSNLIVGVP